MLSVPPELTVPHTPSTPPSMVAVIATISASNLTVLGQRSACNGFACELIAYTSLRNAMCSGSPL
jgi:hypothetical protein